MNIIWARPADPDEADPAARGRGHDVGKTSFCRLIRYLLGEEHFGNARLVRNCFEAVITAQANRLAHDPAADAAALARLEAEDLVTPSDEAREKYRRSGKGYLIRCDHCGETYSWLPDMDLREGLCTKCGKTYDCEFGMLVE